MQTLQDVIAGMSAESQTRIAARSAELHIEVEGLNVLPKLDQRSQEVVDPGLRIKQLGIAKS